MASKSNKAVAPTVDDRVYHLRLREGEISPYVLLPSDQATTERVASIWRDVREIAYNREYRTVNGVYKGLDLTMTSTGIGDQPTEICINELKKVGAHTCISIGNAESIRSDIEIGDIIIPVACMRKGGAVTHYVKDDFPSFAHPLITKTLIDACQLLGIEYKLGVICTINSYYVGQARPLNADPNSFFPYEARNLIERLQNAKIIALDMDTAGELIIGFLHRMRMGAVLHVNANRITETWGDNGGEEKALRIASEAVRILSESEHMSTSNNFVL